MAEPVCIPDLALGWSRLVYEPFREGVEIHHVCTGEPAVAILRYAPGARIPLHRHMGVETIYVLAGSQCDERGCYAAGALVVNPEGSEHSVWSDEGCTVLIQWDRPVKILEEGDATY